MHSAVPNAKRTSNVPDSRTGTLKLNDCNGFVVGVRRFELRASASQTQRSAKLSYTPAVEVEPDSLEAMRHTPSTSIE